MHIILHELFYNRNKDYIYTLFYKMFAAQCSHNVTGHLH